MPIEVVRLPDNTPDRQWALVWVKPSGDRSAPFFCDTRPNVERAVAQYAIRAKKAEDNGWDNL